MYIVTLKKKEKTKDKNSIKLSSLIVKRLAYIHTYIHTYNERVSRKTKYSLAISDTWPRGYKTFFMLNSTEHEIFPAHQC